MSSVLFILSKILLEHYLDLTSKIPIPNTLHLPVVKIVLYNRPTVYLLFTYKQVHQIETVYIDQTHVCQL